MYFSARSIRLLAIGFLVFTCLELFTSLYYMTNFGIALFAGLGIKFIDDLGKRIEIRDMIAFMSVLQWIIGPTIAYNILPLP